MDLFTILIVLVYLLAVGYLGYLGFRRTKTAADYMLAGREAHPVVMALSYGATFISTSAIVGFGGVAGLFGMSLLWLTFLNIFVGIFIAFVFLGGPTRRMGHHLDAHTFPELLGRRFNSKFIQVFAGLVIFIFMPLYAMAVINGAAEFLGTTFNMHFDTALYFFAVIVALYVILGGLKGVMLTDALQGTIMLIGTIVLLTVTYAKLGGVGEAHQSLAGMDPPGSLASIGHQGWTSMPKFGWASPAAEAPHAYDLWWIVVSTIVMGVGIGVLAQPQLIVRFMTVKSKQSLNRAVAMGGIFIFFMTGVAFIVGPLSNVYFAEKEAIECKIVNDSAMFYADPDRGGKLFAIDDSTSPALAEKPVRLVAYRLPDEGPDDALRHVLFTPDMRIKRGAAGENDVLRPGLISIGRTVGPGTTVKGNRDTIIPEYVSSAMPRWFGIVFLLTLLAAAMSTVSSQFHAIGTSIGRDVFEQLTHKHSEKSVLITRIGITVGIITAIWLGGKVRGNIIALATSIFFGLCGSAFLPAFVGGLFSRRMTRAAAICSMVTGFCVSMFWMVFVNAKTAGGLGICKVLFGRATLVPEGFSATWNVVDPLIVALPAAVIAAVVVTLVTRPMDPAHVDYCFGGPKPEEK